MSAPLRSVGGALFVAHLSGDDLVAVVAALERMRRAYERSAAALPAGLEALADRDRAAAERLLSLASRLANLRHAMRHRS